MDFNSSSSFTPGGSFKGSDNANSGVLNRVYLGIGLGLIGTAGPLLVFVLYRWRSRKSAHTESGTFVTQSQSVFSTTGGEFEAQVLGFETFMQTAEGVTDIFVTAVDEGGLWQ
jgi:hypothetical protein